MSRRKPSGCAASSNAKGRGIGYGTTYVYLGPNTATPVRVGTKTFPATTVGELNNVAVPNVSRPLAAWVLLYSWVARFVAS